MNQLTKICWHLIAPSYNPDFLGKVCLNLALDLVTSFCGHKTACWEPVGWDEGLWALVIPSNQVKVIMVVVEI